MNAWRTYAQELRASAVAILTLVVLAGAVPAEAAATSAPPLESAQLLPTYANWQGEGRVVVPGVYGTRRVSFDPDTKQPVEVALALATPILSPGPAAWAAGGPPRVALTFDDGPDARYTAALLDIFAQHNARATFFVLGALVSGNRDIVKRMEQERHEIGIHTWWHADLTKLSNEAIANDLRRCQNALDAVIDRPVRWVRPPYGSVNSRVRSVINQSGYQVAMWSVDPSDWRSPGSSVVASRVLGSVRDGSVVLLHDGGGNRAGTVAAMRRVVPELKARGYELVTLSELEGLTRPAPAEEGMILSVGDERFEISARYDDVRVEVDGVEVDIGSPPVMTRDQFLIPARPVLKALGAQVGWDAELLAVTFEAPRGDFVVKLNSLDVTRNDRPLFVKLPSIYYRGVAMIPAWLIANACRADVQYDPERRTIGFFRGAHSRMLPNMRRDMLTLRSMDGAIISGPWPGARFHPGFEFRGANLSAAI